MHSDWCDSQCRDLVLGDARRVAVVGNVLNKAVKTPAGTVTGVLTAPAERQAAYKLLEGRYVTYEPLRRAFGAATARMAAGLKHVLVAVDGSSLSLPDPDGTRFGAVGATSEGGRGMKVITAYAMSLEGVPLGVLDQQWWAREPRLKTRPTKMQKLADRETRYWCQAIEASKLLLAEAAPKAVPWFVADREADGFYVLACVREKALFTIRANANRCVIKEDGTRGYLHDVLVKRPRKIRWLDVPATAKRSSRRARLETRVAQVTLDMEDSWTKKRAQLAVSVVELREVGTTPKGEQPILWRLYTNHRIKTPEDLDLIINSYRARWRIEEFHKTWKSGACNVEGSRLRGQKALVVWATIMATVAARIEHLKVLARTTPNAPPEPALSPHELKALLLLRPRYKKSNEKVPKRIPNIEVAVRWIADMGGYTGKSSGGPPGATTIRRGLERLDAAAKLVEILESTGN